MAISVVIDASVLVSAFLFPSSVPGAILTLADRQRFTAHVSPILIDETRHALLSPRLVRAYGHDQGSVAAWLAKLETMAKVFAGELPDIGKVCRDPNDDHVIAAAVAVGAEVVVTGDKDLLSLGHHDCIRFITERSFLSEIQA